MNFNFKKIASAASSLVMVGSTVALAAAANYPMPFVSGSSADVAIVVGDNASADLTAAAALSADLSTTFVANGGSTTTTTTTTTGEVFPLFTGSTHLYLNSSLNAARNIITDDDLPTVLADGDISANVDADYTQTINLNGANRILFGQEPSSDDDPTVYLDIGTTAATHLYNATVIFDRAVNFTHADSQGETLELFGKEWTVGADTSSTELVLYKSSEKILLSLGGTSPTPSRQVDVDGSMYTVELVSGSDSDATVRVTDSSGSTESKEIDEDQSKKVNGIEIALTSVDESEALGQVTAELTVASDKIVLVDASEVRYGTDEDPIDGTQVDFVDTAYTGNITQFRVQVYAQDSDEDAITVGQSFPDPVFGSFKVDFTGLSSDLDDESSREMITFDYSGNDELTVEFTNHNEDTKSVTWTDNSSTSRLAYGEDARDVYNVYEMSQINKTEYVVVGNQDEAYLIELTTISNSTAGNGYSEDRIEFRDVFNSANTYEATITSEGSGTITIGGLTYSVSYTDDRSISDEEFVRLNYPDSAAGAYIFYPTIETSMGAKIGFYEPLTINLTDIDGSGTDVTSMIFPDGDGSDGYNSGITVDLAPTGHAPRIFSINSVALGNTTNTTAVTVGKLEYNFTYNTADQVTIYLNDPRTTTSITRPAMYLLEEEDDDTSSENALIIVAEGAGTDADGVGVSTVISTSGLNGRATYTQLDSSNDLSQLLSLRGTLVTLDDSESDQQKATVSYPDEQVEAMIYLAEGEAMIGGGNSGALGDIVYDASEVSSVSNKNLIVLGGSCINTVAAQLLGSSSPLCGAAFTAETQVGTGSFLIQSFESPWNSNKIALLVAGYEAEDTINAANALKSNTVDTMVGKKYTGTTATSLTPVL